MPKFSTLTAITALSIGLATQAQAGTVSPVQSSATPFGLDPIGDVQLRGSDADALDFQTNDLPGLREIVDTRLNERQAVQDVASMALDPNDLYLAETSDVRVYFVGEGAGYRNSFGVYTGDSSDALSGDASLILPDASTSGYYSYYEGDYRSTSAPVAPGDFVDLGTFEEGTQLNMFLIANGAGGGTQTWYTDSALNADSIEHFVVLATPDNPYLLVGVEDLYGGGDQDYNDVVVALDVGTTTVKRLMSKAVPLPGYMAALLGPVVLMLMRRRKADGEQTKEFQAC